MPDLSVQLYTVRDALADDFDGTLAKLAGFGFTAVEPFGSTASPTSCGRGLAAHGLSAPTAHVGLLNGDQDAIFALAVELGIGTVIEPMVDPARWQDVDRRGPDRHRAQCRRRARQPSTDCGSATTITTSNWSR